MVYPEGHAGLGGKTIKHGIFWNNVLSPPHLDKERTENLALVPHRSEVDVLLFL